MYRHTVYYVPYKKLGYIFYRVSYKYECVYIHNTDIYIYLKRMWVFGAVIIQYRYRAACVILLAPLLYIYAIYMCIYI